MKINKNLILEGAWDIDVKASGDARNLQNAASRENFEKNPVQYFTNWYIRGPLRHLPSELYGKVAEMMYALLKHTDSKPITSIDEFRKELSRLDGPWNKEKEAFKLGLEHIDKALTEIKNKHFMQWMINPFVKGELHSKINYKQKEDLELELAKYGDGKTVRTNDETQDRVREIDHKRKLDKLVVESLQFKYGLRSWLLESKNISIPASMVNMQAINSKMTDVIPDYAIIKQDFDEIDKLKAEREKTRETAQVLGTGLGALAGLGINGYSQLSGADPVDTSELITSTGAGALAGYIGSPILYDKYDPNLKRMKTLEQNLKNNLNRTGAY